MKQKHNALRIGWALCFLLCEFFTTEPGELRSFNEKRTPAAAGVLCLIK